MRVQSLTEIKSPADCRNAQLKMSAKQTRIPQQERRGVLESRVEQQGCDALIEGMGEIHEKNINCNSDASGIRNSASADRAIACL